MNIKIKTYKENLDLLQVNSDEINNKNIQITELMKQVDSLKSSYKLFRIILSQIASFNPRKNLNLFLENPKFKNYDYTDDRIINILTIYG